MRGVQRGRSPLGIIVTYYSAGLSCAPTPTSRIRTWCARFAAAAMSRTAATPASLTSTRTMPLRTRTRTTAAAWTLVHDAHPTRKLPGARVLMYSVITSLAQPSPRSRKGSKSPVWKRPSRISRKAARVKTDFYTDETDRKFIRLFSFQGMR